MFHAGLMHVSFIINKTIFKRFNVKRKVLFVKTKMIQCKHDKFLLNKEIGLQLSGEPEVHDDNGLNYETNL